MSKVRQKSRRSKQSAKKDESADKTVEGFLPSARGIRETVESIVIAFVLAFLFRTFEAEAFVIPTGSMAPTLWGANKDVTCPQCGRQYRASASSENDDGHGPRSPVISCTCPYCFYTLQVAPDDPNNPIPGASPDVPLLPTYSGDRIIVAKVAYEFNSPERWDVIVFHWPIKAQTNYIKRLVGLPGETLYIHCGDVFVQGPGENAFQIARKPSARKLLAMMIPVYDNQYEAKQLIEAGWPQRWQADPGSGWESTMSFEQDDRRGKQSLKLAGDSEAESWVRYRHIVPSFDDWKKIESGVTAADLKPRPQLIADGYAYNTSVTVAEARRDRTIAPAPNSLGMNWVGDLGVECELEVDDAKGEVLLRLVEGGRVFLCRIDLASGTATLSIDGVEGFQPTAQTSLKAPGNYDVIFANVDNQLRLIVDGSEVAFDASTDFPEGFATGAPTQLDLTPAAVGGKGTTVTLKRLKLLRDIYYIAVPPDESKDERFGIAEQNAGFAGRDRMINSPEVGRLTLLSTPEMFRAFAPDNLYKSQTFELKKIGEGRHPKDQFFAMGDNSPQSQDSRLWWSDRDPEYWINRDLLIGKAMVIYWPHPWGGFWPNWSRMLRPVR